MEEIEKKATKKLIFYGFVNQYLILIGSIITGCFISFFNSYPNLLLKTLFLLPISIIIYCFLYFLLYIYFCFTSPKKCKILHLFGKNICMKPIYSKNKKLDFYTDFEKIIEYAKNKKYPYVQMETHELILFKLLKKYTKITNHKYRKECKEKDIGFSYEINSSIGKFTIERIEDKINTSAKYEYKIVTSKKEFKKTMKFIKMYKII